MPNLLKFNIKSIKKEVLKWLIKKNEQRHLWQKLIGINWAQWTSVKDIIIGLLICSLFINILALVFPMSLLQVYDRIIPNKSEDTLGVLFIGIVLVMVTEAVLRILRTKVAAWMDARLSYQASMHAMEHLLFSNLSEYRKHGPGVHMERINNLDTLKDFYGGHMIVTLVDLPFLVIFLLLIGYIGHWLVIIPIIMIILLTLTIVKSTHAAKAYSPEKNGMAKTKTNFLVEILSGIITIKSLAMEEQMIRRHDRLQDSRTKQGVKFAHKQAEISRVIAFYSQINMILTVGVGVLAVIDGSMTMGGISACSLLAGRSIQPVANVMNLWNKFQIIYLASEGHNKILEISREANNIADKIPTLCGYLCLDNVSMRYQDTDEDILKEVTLNVPYGDFVAITGDSESGKSTLASIIAGLLKPSKGEVTIDGHKIYDYNLQDIRKNIGYLSQQANLFDGTILENITLFRTGEYIEKAKKLIEKIGLNKEIELMKNGYNTKVGAGSLELVSKGFKQGITIVRSLINDPPIIIFDEANLAMDISTDKHLIKYLETLKGKRTVLLITSRPSILKIANRVYELKQGNLILKQSGYC